MYRRTWQGFFILPIGHHQNQEAGICLLDFTKLKG